MNPNTEFCTICYNNQVWFLHMIVLLVYHLAWLLWMMPLLWNRRNGYIVNQEKIFLISIPSIEGCLTPNTPRSEDMRLEPSLNVTPEGSLADIPTVIKRETREQSPEGDLLGTSSETTYMEIPNTCVKTIHKSPIPGVPKSLQGTKEANRAEALASTWQFFAAVDRRNVNVPPGNQLISIEVHERDNMEVPDVLTTTVATTTVSTTTPPVTLDVELRGTSSPRISLPKGSPSCPTVTATCRPRTWMQQLTEGQTNEPRKGRYQFKWKQYISGRDTTWGYTWWIRSWMESFTSVWSSWSEISYRYNAPKSKKVSWEWCIGGTYPNNQNIVMMCPPGDKEIIDFTLHDMVILSTEEEVEEEVEVEEGESCFRKGKWIDLMEDLAEDMFKVIIQEHNNKLPQI